MERHIVDPRTFPCYAHSEHPQKFHYKRLAQRQILNLDTPILQLCLCPCPEFLELFTAVSCGAQVVTGT